MLASHEDCRIIEKSIDEKYRQQFFEKKKTVIFGCTVFARNIRDILRDRGIEVFAMLDNNPQKAGKSCLGVDVWMPEDFFGKGQKQVVVIICSKYSHEMVQQLIQLGHNERNILDIPVSENCCVFNDSEEDFENKLQEVRQGVEIYGKIRSEYAENAFVFLCPYPGTGDIYMACSYLQEYCVRNGIDNYIFLVIDESCRKVAELFSVRNIEVISELEKTRLLQAWEFLGNERIPLKPLLYWGWRTKRYLYADHYPDITFQKMFLYDVFGLNKAAVRILPTVDRNDAYAKMLFERKGLRKGKTVILSPYAGSFISEMGMNDWMDLAEGLRKKGFHVCTNCDGKTEKPIEGTTPVFFPYYEAVSVVEYAGGFIALRSGLCDVVSSAKCRMVVLYENGFNASRYRFFSLERMGLNKDVKEMVFAPKITVREILRYYA